MESTKQNAPQPSTERSACRFGSFVLDPARGTLSRLDGAEVSLRPKTFEVLRHLAEQAGRLVPRESLMREVWPDVFVTDDSISQCIAEIRRALGDEGTHFVRTLPKRGYLLVSDSAHAEAPLPGVIAAPDDAAAGPHPSPEAGRGGRAPALALPDRPSLAVLPFQNMSGDPEQEYFADGMVEDITTALSRIRWLFVIARNSAFTYKGKAVDVRQVGRNLGVRYVLEGSVRKADGRVRVTCQLVEAEIGAHLWAERFDGEIDDVFGLQDRVAEAVAGAIEPRLRRLDVERARAKPTDSLDAYDLYLRALPHHYAQTKPDSDASLGLLRRAIALDPGFALAKAFAAWSIMIREVQGWLEPGELEAGARLAGDALADAGDDPMTLRCAAQAVAWLAHDRTRGLVAAERALALNPNSAQVLGGAAWTSLYAGRPQRAIELFGRALRLSPLDPELSYFLSGLGFAFLMARRFEEALEAGERAVAEMPDRGTGYRAVIAALVALGRMEDARAAALRYQKANPAGARDAAARVAAKFADQRYVQTMVGGLRAAGLPE